MVNFSHFGPGEIQKLTIKIKKQRKAVGLKKKREQFLLQRKHKFSFKVIVGLFLLAEIQTENLHICH